MSQRENESAPEPIALMREEFRRRLEQFYAGLHLAAPYDTVEKAVGLLVRRLQALPTERRTALAAHPAARLEQYTAAFRDSGLSQKHRGIIAGMVKAGNADVPAECQHWLGFFT